MNPTVLITGASRGIGRGIALELAKLGYDLVINYAGNAQAAGQTAEHCVTAGRAAGNSVRAELCQADVGSAAVIERVKGNLAEGENDVARKQKRKNVQDGEHGGRHQTT